MKLRIVFVRDRFGRFIASGGYPSPVGGTVEFVEVMVLERLMFALDRGYPSAVGGIVEFVEVMVFERLTFAFNGTGGGGIALVVLLALFCRTVGRLVRL